MEIERKYLIPKLPAGLVLTDGIEYEQGYLCVKPVVRVRREGEEYWLTYKSEGLMIREESNLPLTAESYAHLVTKTDGSLIHKTRYFIPYGPNRLIELDIFHDQLAPLILAEVEFPSEEEANRFAPPDWFGQEVTFDGRYHNSYLSGLKRYEP